MVLYEMLCGRPAFDSESQFELMAAQVSEAPRAPQGVNSAVPKEIGAVVLKALAKDPSERYQTVMEFDQALVQASERARMAKGEAMPMAPVSVVQLTPRMSIELVPDPVLAAAALQHREFEVAAEEAPSFLAMEEEDSIISRKHILIGGAAGA